jgi:EpsI family protein
MTSFGRGVVSCGLLLGALAILHFRAPGEAVPVRKPLDAFPHVLGAWHGREATIFETNALNTLKLTDALMRRYVDPAGRSIWLYIGYWATQTGGEIHSPRNCLPAAGWEPIEASLLTIPLPAPHPAITINRYLIQKQQETQLVLYWYHSQGKAVASDLAAKIELVRRAIARNRTDGALVRISSPVHGGVQQTTERLVAYAQAIYPVLGEHLPD